MEDHLKNKDRLDQEWAALCAYETDPSSTEIAESKANIKQNRPGAGLPYDHSRVVLNDLTNANNSDYINASTIVSAPFHSTVSSLHLSGIYFSLFLKVDAFHIYLHLNQFVEE